MRFLTPTVFFLAATVPQWGKASSFTRFIDYRLTHHSRQYCSGRMISPSQRPLPDNTQHSQQKNIHAPGGIRTHSLSRRAEADLRLRSRGHWDRLTLTVDSLQSHVLYIKQTVLEELKAVRP